MAFAADYMSMGLKLWTVLKPSYDTYSRSRRKLTVSWATIQRSSKSVGRRL